MSKKVTAVGYARVSTSQQAADGLSLRAQMDRIYRYGMRVSTFVTEERSAREGTLHLKGLLRAVADKSVTHVLICDVSRFSRSRAYGMNMIRFLTNKGLTVIFVDQNLVITADNVDDISGPLDDAERESNMISERVRAGKQYARSTGRYCGGKLPFGVEVYESYDDVRKCRPEPDEIKVIDFIEKCRSNRYSAVELNRLMSRITDYSMKTYPIRLYNAEGDEQKVNTQALTHVEIAGLLNDYDVTYRGSDFTSQKVANIRPKSVLRKYYEGNDDLITMGINVMTI